MDLDRLKQMTVQLMANHPEHKEELMELYQLAVDEIEEGGSEAHECELAISDMEYLIENGEL